MEELYEELLKKCEENGYSEEEIENIKRAYEFAYKCHKGKMRKNNEEFITHPLNVALICASLNVDSTTIISALVHETIDNGPSSLEEIESLFGEEVMHIVSSLMKVNRLKLTDESESTSLYLRKVLVALSEDVRVLIIKLAGRVHNMRTIYPFSKEKQRLKAIETQNVLIPIAHRLGINQLKTELEDICFRVLKNEDYKSVEESLPASREKLNEILEETKETIIEELKQNNISFEIKGRVKSNSSIYNKLSKGKKMSEIYDIIGLRIICEEESECYLIIGLIHSLYRPIPKRFKDYISMPKGNSYQSLHTGVFGTEGFPVEVQVRTKEMNEIAEHGVASHWSYKEHSKQIQNVMEQKLQMFRNIIEANSNDITDDDTFAQNMSELLSTSIYVYTPKGDVVELPEGSCPVDFAYRIHSRVGDTTIGAIVNDTIVPLDYHLQDNDIVKIMTNAQSEPNKDWLNFVKTTQAKAKIKAFFSKKDREEYIERGRNLLEKELKRQHITVSSALDDEHINKLVSDLKVTNFDEVLLNIGALRYTPSYIVDLMYNDKKNVQDVLLDKVMNSSTLPKVNHKNDIVVSGCDDILVNLASCCKPVFGDEIIGYITKGQGITVHKKDCVNVKDLNERLIDVYWNENRNDENKYYISKITVYTNGVQNNILDIVTKSMVRGININSINEVNKGGKVCYDLILKVKNKADLDNFIEDLRTLKFVTSISRY